MPSEIESSAFLSRLKESFTFKDRIAHIERIHPRAARRGELVKQHHADAHWMAGWQMVVNRTTGEAIDLSNPFDTQGKPTTMKV